MVFWTIVDLIGIAASVAVLATAASLDPDPRGFGTHEQLGLAPCAYLAETGHPCVSCGMTTAFANMAALRPLAALRANPMGVILFLVTLVMPFWLGHALLRRRDPFRFVAHPAGRWLLPVLVFLLIACWLFRSAVGITLTVG